MSASAGSARHPITRALAWVFEGSRFAMFSLFLLGLYEVLLFGLLLFPETEGPLGSFARDFKTWCFGYDPATGRIQPMSVVAMLTEPAALAATILIVWWKPVREALRAAPGSLVGPGVAAAAVVAVAGAALGLMGAPSLPEGEMPFPAERLRTAHKPPELDLVDQNGERVSLDDLRGKVVVLTAVYATCGYTCPMILGQARRVVEKLAPEQREELTVIGVSLDPENDTPALMGQMADGQGVSAPTFRLVTGDPARVNALLDQMGVARVRNPETKQIDHANLFLLVDRTGQVAYRFSLGEQQEKWLESALRLLIGEQLPTG